MPKKDEKNLRSAQNKPYSISPKHTNHAAITFTIGNFVLSLPKNNPNEPINQTAAEHTLTNQTIIPKIPKEEEKEEILLPSLNSPLPGRILAKA